MAYSRLDIGGGWNLNTIVKLEACLNALIGTALNRPKGSLAGHAAALPLEDLVHSKLEEAFPKLAFRQFEFLNTVLATVSEEDLATRITAFGPPSLQSLLCRGKAQMRNWSPRSLFDVKQNDTAETIICESMPFNSETDSLILADVKSHNVTKNGQPPNIMSAGKLAEALALALEEGEIRFDFVYLGISWEILGDKLLVTDTRVISLFKMPPTPYINWAAAEQLQFHIQDAPQDFTESKEEWAKKYLRHFSDSLENRIAKQNVRLERFRKLS